MLKISSSLLFFFACGEALKLKTLREIPDYSFRNLLGQVGIRIGQAASCQTYIDRAGRLGLGNTLTEAEYEIFVFGGSYPNMP